ncbi:MAG: hypothetical protein SFY69_10635 [Planctomycetota bacterium]|nr:hypothetical protein [Planctomycetota bacterium]
MPDPRATDFESRLDDWGRSAANDQPAGDPAFTAFARRVTHRRWKTRLPAIGAGAALALTAAISIALLTRPPEPLHLRPRVITLAPPADAPRPVPPVRVARVPTRDASVRWTPSNLRVGTLRSPEAVRDWFASR